MDVLPLYTSIPHNDGIAATDSVLNTNNCQFLDAILQLIHFNLDHNIFTFDNQFFIQTHGTAMGTNFAPQYANVFMHKFEQDFFAPDMAHGRWVPFIIQYFPGAEKLHHVLRNPQHIINDDEHLAKIFPTPPLLIFKQPPNLKQTIVQSKLPSLQDNVDHNTIPPCHGNLCKTCQITDMDITHHMDHRYS
eukprot:g33598.t1